jgi:hypothetical protein
MAGDSTPSEKDNAAALKQYRMNPFPVSSPEAEKIKYPPGGGTAVYWLDGRFNITLDNFMDEQIQGDKAIFSEILCFRQEGKCVYAKNKSKEFFVFDLSTLTFKKSSDIATFSPEDQTALTKLKKKNRGNVYFDDTTLMADL